MQRVLACSPDIAVRMGDHEHVDATRVDGSSRRCRDCCSHRNENGMCNDLKHCRPKAADERPAIARKTREDISLTIPGAVNNSHKTTYKIQFELYGNSITSGRNRQGAVRMGQTAT